MSGATEDLKQRYMSAEDKAAIKQGSKAFCSKLKYCSDKFSEIIFIVSLLAATAIKLYWAFGI